MVGGSSRAADGFFLVNEMGIGRKRVSYPAALVTAYQVALRAIVSALPMPIRYAGPEQWSVFAKPSRFDSQGNAVGVPGTQEGELCLHLEVGLWATFVEMSLWVEALCIHEWCLFTERVEQPGGFPQPDGFRQPDGFPLLERSPLDRGTIYTLLTDRPDNRRPLSWERNRIDVLILEGLVFICPWTGKAIASGVAYDLDHLIPIALYPINELWNLVPADPYFNSHRKRARMPSADRILQALPHLATTYTHYGTSSELAEALKADARGRFSAFVSEQVTSERLAKAVGDYLTAVKDSRNPATFS